jgi:Skp family chaperone for outer membrane proteins
MPLALATAQSYFRSMKRICFFSAVCLLSLAPLARAQDAATAAAVASRQEAEENYNTLKGHVDDLVAARDDQAKQIQSLRKDIEDLRLQMSKPSGNYASQDDLKHLAAAVQDLDKKREADKELILKDMEKLGQAVAAPIPTTPHGNSHPVVADPGTSAGPVSHDDQNGFYYTIKKDDTLSLIAQAYREQQGIKVTTKQIQEANPNVNPAKLKVGMKIFIPAPKK